MASEKLFTKDVLKIVSLGGLVVTSLFIPGLPSMIRAIGKEWRSINKKELGRIIKRLQKQEMISIAETNGSIQINITEKGKKRLLQYDFENIKLKSQRRDKKWRMVIFDIPEEKKSARDMFRRKLIELGFIRLQDSVFIGVYPCKDEIDFLCHFLEISDYVSLVVLDKIERGEELIFKPFKTF